MAPKISVIIVSWNVADALARCLKSIINTKYSNLDVIVIENNSTDDSFQIIKSFKLLEIRLIRNSSNLGFPKGVNQGLCASSGEFILLLNPDTRISPDFFVECLNFFTNHPTAGIMGPKLINSDKTPQGSVFHDPSVMATIKEFWFGNVGLTAKYIPDEIRPTIVDAVSGACMFFPRRTLDKVGFFTEQVFMYYEDLDYCRRIRASGLRVYFNPQISVIHQHGTSSAKTSQGKYRNLIESVIYPLRKLFKYPNNIQSFQRYQTESGIWYNGWLKHIIITVIIWTGRKIHPFSKS